MFCAVASVRLLELLAMTFSIFLVRFLLLCPTRRRVAQSTLASLLVQLLPMTKAIASLCRANNLLSSFRPGVV
jgi:hypothetical protein